VYPAPGGGHRTSFAKRLEVVGIAPRRSQPQPWTLLPARATFSLDAHRPISRPPGPRNDRHRTRGHHAVSTGKRHHNIALYSSKVNSWRSAALTRYDLSRDSNILYYDSRRGVHSGPPWVDWPAARTSAQVRSFVLGTSDLQAGDPLVVHSKIASTVRPAFRQSG